MRTIALAILTAALLSGCGTTQGDRGLSGAGIGAGIGIIGGPPGMVVGGAIGATVGMVTKPQQVNLGRPVWRG
jgi:osmotically inducible lipoprotein OsmB